MSRHLDGSPKPVDPLWLRQHEWLHLTCRCGHRAALHIGALALQHQLSGEVRLYRVIDRLRCHRCGSGPAGVEVKSRRR
ncbi:Hypothetical protein RMP42_05854 (plasmid) [Roseomonas mucosa]|nr:Hypothetical protein RMP42_05854 [Roseomonas mucosa]